MCGVFVWMWCCNISQRKPLWPAVAESHSGKGNGILKYQHIYKHIHIL